MDDDTHVQAPEPAPATAAPAQSAVAPIPASIVKALCRVQATLSAVAKSQRNQHGGYNFASTDDIYAAVARKFGEAGLLIYPLELSPPVIKRIEKTEKSGAVVVSQWGHFCYGYVLATEEATWFDPRSARTIFIQILGPQSFNAAESYCQKQYLRALLKLPTGDMDLDSLPQAETEEAQVAMTGNGRGQRKSSSAAKKDGTTETFNGIRADIQAAISAEHLAHIRETYAEDWAALPDRWSQLLDDDYAVKMEGFAAVQNAA